MVCNQPISNIRVINKNLSLKIFFSLFLCLFLGIALPAHHHSDGLEHGDCSFCVVQKSTPTVETVYSLPVVMGSFVELFQPSIQSYSPFILSAFQSRAPPVSAIS